MTGITKSTIRHLGIFLSALNLIATELPTLSGSSQKNRHGCACLRRFLDGVLSNPKGEGVL